MNRRKVGGQLGKIASGKPRQQKAPTPTSKGDNALVNRSIQTTRERWKQLPRANGGNSSNTMPSSTISRCTKPSS